MLVLTYFGLEYKTYNKLLSQGGALVLSEQLEEDIPITIINLPPSPPQKLIVTEVITVVENIAEIEETILESTEIGQHDAIQKRIVSAGDIEVEEFEEDIEVPFAVIENVLIFPGCKGNKQELKICFQRKMNEHLQKNFKYPKAAEERGISGKVYVFFLIDKTGYITKIKS